MDVLNNKNMKKNLLVILLLLTLPFKGFCDDTVRYAIVNLSVCNLRSTPNFSAEMVTQALLGTPVHVIGEDGWYNIITPEGYTGWVHPAGIRLLSKEEYSRWNSSEKFVVTSLTGIVRSGKSADSPVVSDLVGGDRLLYLGKKGHYIKVRFPDGREGYVCKKSGMRESSWRKSLDSSAEAIIATARSMNGFPYLWAGMSPKGMDCSGFVRTVLFLHDIIIPRDASQQAPKGERIEIADDFSNLAPGDLIFFGKRGVDGAKDRVSHVAIYIGGKRFIHSLGRVREASFDPDDPDYDESDHKRLLYASRILPYINKQEGLETTQTNGFYNE